MVKPELNSSTLVQDLTSQQLERWLETRPVCLIEFYGNWCIYHLLTKRKNELLAAEFGSALLAGSFDVEGSEELCEAKGIEFVPTIALFHDGHVVLKWCGDTDLDVMSAGITGFLEEQGSAR